MSNFDLAKLKLKTADDLEDDERQFIIDHQDELNDEDKDAYSSFLPPEDPKTTQEEEEPTPPPTDEPEPKKEPLTFKSQEEMDEYFEKKFGSQINEIKSQLPKPQPEPEPKPKPEKKYIEGQPKSWEEFDKAIKQAKEDAKTELVEQLEKEKKEAQTKQQELEQAREKAIAGLKDEYAKLAESDKSLPKLDTQEGVKKFEELVKWGSERKQENLTDTYGLWSKIPVEHGGGLDTQQKKELDKKKVEAQKKAAASLSGKGGEAPKKERSYQDLKKMDLSEIIEERLAN